MINHTKYDTNKKNYLELKSLCDEYGFSCNSDQCCKLTDKLNIYLSPINLSRQTESLIIVTNRKLNYDHHKYIKYKFNNPSEDEAEKRDFLITDPINLLL